MLFNQGPQDSLLFDGRNSFFSNVGYSRSSNFAMEYADLDPSGAPAKLGHEVRFDLDRIGDLVGNVDLRVSVVGTAPSGVFDAPPSYPGGDVLNSLTDGAGFAMIEYVQLKVNDNEIEKIDGEMLYIMNQLHRDPQNRYRQIIKEDKGANDAGLTSAGLRNEEPDMPANNSANETQLDRLHGAHRVLTNYNSRGVSGGKLTPTNYQHDFIIPLGLFFTKHPSQYLPHCAVAGSNTVRVVVKFRKGSAITVFNSNTDANVAAAPELRAAMKDPYACEIVEGKCQLRVAHVHLTGPEAEALISKEHVRLMKLWQHHTASTLIKDTTTGAGPVTSAEQKYSIDLQFLHPVSELVVVIRNTKFLNGVGATDGQSGPYYWGFEGKGMNSFTKKADGTLLAPAHYNGPVVDADANDAFMSLLGWDLKLNNQSRHPSVSSGSSSGTAMDRDYTMHRILPQHHSMNPEAGDYVEGIAEESKEILVIPFALNPEGVNPSGSINFSKVSKAQLNLYYMTHRAEGESTGQEFQVDVYAQYYNWSQLRDGRMILSFG